jgi:Cofactor assembly of complex C subunit B, CCB2/CCB4
MSQILPGKVEFTYLPINCQSVLVLPLPSGGAAVMGTNQAKVLKLNDLNRVRSVVNIYKNLVTNS